MLLSVGIGSVLMLYSSSVYINSSLPCHQLTIGLVLQVVRYLYELFLIGERGSHRKDVDIMDRKFLEEQRENLIEEIGPCVFIDAWQ